MVRSKAFPFDRNSPKAAAAADRDVPASQRALDTNRIYLDARRTSGRWTPRGSVSSPGTTWPCSLASSPTSGSVRASTASSSTPRRPTGRTSSGGVTAVGASVSRHARTARRRRRSALERTAWERPVPDRRRRGEQGQGVPRRANRRGLTSASRRHRDLHLLHRGSVRAVLPRQAEPEVRTDAEPRSRRPQRGPEREDDSREPRRNGPRSP